MHKKYVQHLLAFENEISQGAPETVVYPVSKILSKDKAALRAEKLAKKTRVIFSFPPILVISWDYFFYLNYSECTRSTWKIYTNKQMLMSRFVAGKFNRGFFFGIWQAYSARLCRYTSNLKVVSLVVGMPYMQSFGAHTIKLQISLWTYSGLSF